MLFKLQQVIMTVYSTRLVCLSLFSWCAVVLKLMDGICIETVDGLSFSVLTKSRSWHLKVMQSATVNLSYCPWHLNN